MSTYNGNAANPFGASSLPDDLATARSAASVNPAFQSHKDGIERLRNMLPRPYFSDSPLNVTLGTFGSWVDLCEIDVLSGLGGTPPWFYNNGLLGVVFDLQSCVRFNINSAVNILTMRFKIVNNSPAPNTATYLSNPFDFDAVSYSTLAMKHDAGMVWNHRVTAPCLAEAKIVLQGQKALNNAASINIQHVMLKANVWAEDL